VAVASPEPVASEPEPPLLSEPTGGVPEAIVSQDALDEAVAGLQAESGPVAVDAERASGYRYGQRAYLVQLRRGQAAPVLLDPVAGLDLTGLADMLDGPEWVLHAANQDLPCLAELGLAPRLLFDTELGSRLAGLPKVGLSAVVEQLLGVRLAKEHSAVDWSTRPMPQSWLRYAALDVELLLDLRLILREMLEAQGKLHWAEEEFAAVAAAPPTPPRMDPWRRTSGMHTVRNRRNLAAVRALWQAREDMARARDLAPGRLLPDSAIVEAALQMPSSAAELAALKVFSGPANRRLAAVWLGAIERARRMPEAELPMPAAAPEGPPPVRSWPERDPAAAARLSRVRPALADLAAQHRLPVENLLSPDTVRRLAWQPPEELSVDAVAATLRSRGARQWQIETTTPVLLATLLAVPEPVVVTNG